MENRQRTCYWLENKPGDSRHYRVTVSAGSALCFVKRYENEISQAVLKCYDYF
jgi:hypothetical protein